MRSLVLIGICLACFSASYAAVVPFITKCAAADTECLKSSSQAAVAAFTAGLPEYNIEPLEPLVYDTMDASAKELKLILSDLTIKGLKNCKIHRLQRDLGKSKIYLKALCNVVLDGHYDMSGRLLFLPIEGKGKIHVVLRKLAIDVTADMGEKVKDGVKYWDIKAWKHTYELQAKSQIVLENLFNGNELLATAVRALLETSPNEVVNEVGPVIIKNIITKVVKNVDKFFNKVPAEDLALD